MHYKRITGALRNKGARDGEARAVRAQDGLLALVKVQGVRFETVLRESLRRRTVRTIYRQCLVFSI
eukprot:COSAG05_NODE_1271_length_5315_cov_2.397738_2_plen_66_part_00